MDVKTFIAKTQVAFTATHVLTEDDGRSRWLVELKTPLATQHFDYWQGSALTEEPTAADVLECLALDQGVRDECDDVLDYAVNYGYELTAQAADELRTTWALLTENGEKLDSLFGDLLQEVDW